MHGRIEIKVFSDYKKSRELIERTNLIGLVIGSERFIVINYPDDYFMVLISVNRNEIKNCKIVHFIETREPIEICLFGDFKEATEWFYRIDEREATSEKTVEPPKTGQYNVGDRVFVKDYEYPIVLEKAGFIGYYKFLNKYFLISESDILCKEEDHASFKK